MQPKAPVFLILAFSCLPLLASACGGDGEKNPFSVKSEVVTPADHAASLAFAPDGRLFYVEQFTGNIRVVDAKGDLQPAPFAHVNAFQAGEYIEWGTMGLALDPNFPANGYVYVYFTVAGSPGLPQQVKPVVARVKEGSEAEVVIGDLPETSSYANGTGSINFGQDGFLYVSLGDHDVGQLAQDLTVPLGKLLRVNKETGDGAPDNPFVAQPGADPRIFAYGFREDFDFTFHPQSGEIYGSDQTPVSCSELNVINKGNGYGWPYGEFPWSDCSAAEQTAAIRLLAKDDTNPGDFLSFVNSRGMSFVSGQIYPLIGDALLICEGLTNVLRRIVIAGTNMEQDLADDAVVKDCLFDVTVSPDGIVYYSNAKEIRRLIPVPIETE